MTRTVVLAAVFIASVSSAFTGGQSIAQQASPPSAPTQQPAGRGGLPVQGAEPAIALLARFDRNGDKQLDYTERSAAREFLTAHPELRRPTRGGRITRTGTPGPKLKPAEVTVYPASVPLYAPDTLRTLFLEFEHPDWEQELAAFWHTDVEVAAKLTVDGKVYRDVGMSFRGNNSFTNVPEGLKRPFSISLDFVHDQELLGHRSLNLLNSNQDPTFLRSVLYLDSARDYIPAVKANFVRVVINGESWGIYVNQQTFSKEFVQETFKTNKGTRWKSPNNSVGGGFSYLGDDVALYRRWYEMKGSDNLDAWKALIHGTKILYETPPEQLDAALTSVMDIDEVLRFLALDIALVNNDGYWRDGSDFNLYLNPKGKFLLTPHDANEGFRTGGRSGGGAQPDPLAAMDDPNKALRQKLLAVPALREKYLAYVGDIAEKWLDWNRLGPLVEKYKALIGPDVERDTRKHETMEAFLNGIYGPSDATPPPATTIKGFADQRRAALLAHPEIVKARAARPVTAKGKEIRP
jgi:hypothetical protein